MNLYPYTFLATCISSIFLGIFTISKNRYNPLNQLWALICLCAAIWSLSFAIIITTTQQSVAEAWKIPLNASAVYVPVLVLHFSLKLINENRKKILLSGYIIHTIYAFLGFSNYYIKDISPQFDFNYYLKAGPLYIFWVITYLFFTFYSCHVLLKSLKKKISKPKKNQVKYLIFAILAGLLGGATTFPSFYNISFPPFGVHLMPLYTILITYSIFKHNLMDINIVIRKGLVYSTLISSMTIIYIVFALLAENLFKGLIGYKSLPITILTIIFLVILFQPLKNKIQKIIDKYFFHGTIDQIDEENIRLREELQKSEKLKAVATLAAGMAHEIKNPLTSIKTFTEYFPEKYNDPAFANKFKDIVGSEVDRINNIVKQLLEFSKPENLHLKESDINNLFDETLSLLNNDFLKHNIRIEKRYSSIPSVSVDPAQIKQVFLNILLNAVDSIKNSGTIRIKTGVNQDNELEIAIKDTGKGINKEDLKRIFDPFFSKKDGGTGLGLSVVHGIIEKHGGRINVKSAPGNGTCFVVALPTNHR